MRTIDESYKNYTLDEIREDLDHLYKRKSVFKMTRGRITNQAHRKELERLSWYKLLNIVVMILKYRNCVMQPELNSFST